MNKRGLNNHPIISTILTLVVLVSMLIFFDNFPPYYSGYITSQPSPTQLSKPLPTLAPDSTEKPQAMPDEILVKFKPEVAEATTQAILEKQDAKVTKDPLAVLGIQTKRSERQGVTVQEEIPRIKVKVLKVNAAARDAVIAALSNNPAVEFAEPNYIFRPLYIPNDQYLSSQWAMTNIAAPQAWDITKGNPSIIVAVLDTGISQTHPDLAGKIVANAQFTDSPTVDDMLSHGTHVAGIVAANTDNGIGVAALGFNTRLYNVKVVGDDGYGYYSWLINGIIWAADNGANVISMSLGATSPSRILEDAVNYAWSKGAVVVAGAGNYGNSIPFYPAYYQNVMAVAATNSSNQLESWSNRGDWVDIAAPGASIVSTLRGNSYGNAGGTSMATPHVAALAALVLTQVTDTNGNGLLNDEVRECIQISATNLGIAGIGSGLINAQRAVQCKQAPPPDVTPPTVSLTSPTSGSTISGTTNMQASATDNVAVSKVQFYVDSALLATDVSSPYTVSWNTATATNSAHSLTAKAYDTSNNAATSTTVTVTVNNLAQIDTTPPTTTIISPSNGAFIKGTITVSVSATDNVKVAKVELYRNNALVGTDTLTPYTFSWNTKLNTNGKYTLQSKAYDTSNNIKNSTINTITVDNTLPKVTITSPPTNTAATRGATLTIMATATDNTAMKKVEFYVNNRLKCSDSTTPYSCAWAVPATLSTTYQIKAKAYDTAGNTATSLPILVLVK